MITRHHISLAIGSIIILYFPLISTNPVLLITIGAGVCTGVVIPDIQMKKPRQFNALFVAWLFIQLFKKSILRLYVSLYRNMLGICPDTEDKRLTHSVPGLFFVVGMTGVLILGIILGFPLSYPLHFLKIFLAGVIIGLILHFLEDICTKKGLCLFYPFNESCRIAGSIRSCNMNDTRIRLFHLQAGLVIFAIIIVNYSGFCPGYLKWPVSLAAMALCTALMLYHAEVKITLQDSFKSKSHIMIPLQEC